MNLNSSEYTNSNPPSDNFSFKRRSLGRQILLWMVVVSMLPLIIMAYQGYHCARQAIVESTRAYLLAVLKGHGDHFESWFAERRLDLTSFTQSLPLSLSFESPKLDAAHLWQLNSLSKSYFPFETIDVYDLNWRKIKSLPEINDTDTVSLPDNIKLELEKSKDIFIGPVFLQNHKLTSYMGGLIYNNEGKKVGYIITKLNISRIVKNSFYKEAATSKSAKNYFVSEEGLVLTSPAAGEEGMIAQRIKLPPLLFQDKGKKVFSYVDYRGRDVLAAARHFPTLGCTLIAEADWDETMQWLTILKYRAFGTGVVTLLIIVILSARRARRLALPLKSLAQIARKIADGQHEERAGDLGSTEAQEVGLAFNHMLDELAVSRKKLARAASLAAIGELSSSVVHEIRNPLSSIKINLQALGQKVKPDEAYSELAKIASEQVLRIERMLNGLLSFGKPLHLKCVELSFSELWKDVMDITSKSIQKKDVTLEFTEQDQVVLRVDRDLMAGALTNLITNAVEAIDKGGEIRVRIQRDLQTPSCCRIDVSDNGPGIKGDLQEVFTPFFTTKEGGTGLGLANVKKVTEYHGGSVTAGNNEEGGATFTIKLPIGGSPV